MTDRLLPSEDRQDRQGRQEIHPRNLAAFDSGGTGPLRTSGSRLPAFRRGKAAKTAKTASVSALGNLAAFDVAGWAESAHPPRRCYRPRRLDRTRRSVPRARR